MLSLVKGKTWEQFPVHLKGRGNTSLWRYFALGWLRCAKCAECWEDLDYHSDPAEGDAGNLTTFSEMMFFSSSDMHATSSVPKACEMASGALSPEGRAVGERSEGRKTSPAVLSA